MEKYVLGNGLRLILVKNERLPIFSYQTFFDVGGRFETQGLTGATHFLEHMMFKGSRNYPDGAFDSLIEKNGGSANAYTSFDSTVYYENAPVDILEEVIKVEGDRMSSPNLLPELFEKERLVVLEERRMRYDERPQGRMHLEMMKKAFKGTPYGGSVIGEVKDLNSLKRDEVMDFFKKFYAPNNAVVVIVGDIDFKKTLELIKKNYGQIPRNKKLADLKGQIDGKNSYQFPRDFSQKVTLHGRPQNPLFSLVYQGFKKNSKEEQILNVLSGILGMGESSHLYQKYVKGKRPLVSQISMGPYSLNNAGILITSGELLGKISVNRFYKDLIKELKTSCDVAVTPRNVQKIKNNYWIALYSKMQTNSGISSFLGEREAFYGDYKSYTKVFEDYNSIQTDDVKNLCNKIFRNGKPLYITMWNKHKRKK